MMPTMQTWMLEILKKDSLTVKMNDRGAAMDIIQKLTATILQPLSLQLLADLYHS